MQYPNNRFAISEAKDYAGQEVTISGWVTHKRSSGKIRFVNMRDGSGFIQCVFVKGECTDEAFDLADKLTQESSCEITGILRQEARSKSGFELTAVNLRVLQISENYPISPKEHGVEFLMENRHLWVRSNRQWAALRMRSEIFRGIENFFYDHGFIRYDAPILTPTSCEGTSTLFSTDYFDEKAYLTQSGQLYGETGAMAFGRVFVFGPTFRAEKSKTRKHLTEFWMAEPEMAFAELPDVIDLGEGLIKYLLKRVLENCQPEFKLLERNTEKLERWATQAFPRISYDDAIKVLEKRGVGVPWGEDFGAPHETELGEEFGAPVFIHHFPSQIKSFYFKHADEVGKGGVDHDAKYALGADLIAPDGYGELIGGGQREDKLEVLARRVKEHGLALQDYQWYLDMRRFGSVPHGGFGIGLERTVAWLTGVEHVRETVPFPRLINNLKP